MQVPAFGSGTLFRGLMNALTDGRDAQQVSPAAMLGLPWLVADIGGTNARFGYVESANSGIQHVQTLPVTSFSGPAEAAAHYLDHLRHQLGRDMPPVQRAVLAVATAVRSDEIAMTNSPWRFSSAALHASLGVERLLMLNDFEALALSLPKLTGAQTRPIGPVPATPGAHTSGTMAVIGPGTGLGVGGVVKASRTWVALPGEGGHATLAPTNDFESELLRHVRLQHPHVSAERLLSGIGLPTLHDAVAVVLGHNVPSLTAELIVERGASGQDPLCVHTLDTFCALLGGFAGNVALALGARSGIYVGGGIVPRFGERFFTSPFRERFEAKGRARAYLEGIPTILITDTLAALTGAAFALEQLGS
jgi:glucokinase